MSYSSPVLSPTSHGEKASQLAEGKVRYFTFDGEKENRKRFWRRGGHDYIPLESWSVHECKFMVTSANFRPDGVVDDGGSRYCHLLPYGSDDNGPVDGLIARLEGGGRLAWVQILLGLPNFPPDSTLRAACTLDDAAREAWRSFTWLLRALDVINTSWTTSTGLDSVM